MEKGKRCWAVLVLITFLVVCFSGAAYDDKVDDLIRQLGSDDIYVRFKAAKSLGFQGVNLKSR